jgi:dTDP-4-amino-4,6-dideoxygalactose transaminase
VTRYGEKVTTRVYRKAMHTDRYIHFTSHHHHRVQSGTVKCLKNRADKLCEGDNRKEELNHLKKEFRSNGYPRKLLDRTLNQPPAPQPSQQQPSLSDSTAVEPKQKILCLPYIKGLSEEIQRLCRGLSVKTCFKSRNTLRELLTKVKIPLPSRGGQE